MFSGTYEIVIATPTITPGGGTYAAGQTITVATATPGATINYTLNGAEPTPTDAVIASGGTLVAGNFTLKVKANKPLTTASPTVTGDLRDHERDRHRTWSRWASRTRSPRARTARCSPGA